MEKTDRLNHYAERISAIIPTIASRHAALERLLPDAAIILHGSTTMGIDDAHADLDVWVIAPDRSVDAFNREATSRFIEFKTDGKPGHFNVERLSDLHRRIQQCYFPLVYELRHACVIADRVGLCSPIIEAAYRPMREEVRRSWFMHHYVEMRGEHRALDNPIERGDPTAVFLALSKTLEHAMRAAVVLDGEPYHYSKWLRHVASRTPTGAMVTAKVEQIMQLISQGALLQAGPERQHPLNVHLRDIRVILVDSARITEIDEPWLRDWWLFIDQARQIIANVQW